jgi:hypothetical protein
MNELLKTVSYFDQELSISLEIPIDWSVNKDDEFPLSLFAPADSNYRANLSFSQMPVESPTIEILKQAIEETKADQLQEYPHFQQIKEEQIWQDDCPAYLQQYEWKSPDLDDYFEQVFCLILTPSYGLFGIYGTTLKSLRDEYIAIFLHIISSIRFINKS